MEISEPVSSTLDVLLKKAASNPPLKVAVVHPMKKYSLEAAVEAAKAGLIEPIMVGPKDRMLQIAESFDLDISGFEIIDCEHSHASAEIAVALAREQKVQALMKGSLATAELMGAVVHKQLGIRTDRRVSHVFVLQAEHYHKLLLVTDAAINILPDLAVKRDILQNAIDLAAGIGLLQPKVAILAAVEKVKPSMPATIDAAALCKMSDRGQITGAIVDGPLAFDNAISAKAAQIKGIQSPVAGEPDILLVPDLEAGNILAKQLCYLGGAQSAGLVMGARVPIILTSRSDSLQTRIYSCAVASLVSRYKQDQF
ncbi:bifunctional enoyl-CoA hydratase/phosphate acetyltransferase [Pelagibaculum spongiae]|uniref:Phosphate acetyltransferase n=1 Tax=Pelagibaculum spongiae TaxID=2080658 RepID=A0A2V1GY17_9GAMM|nr:bifunctional enoyl-CoA hydratase/phosphate acetyltransferase [Pelagibaculum spongiae]PVZ70543.1 phosphate acetyltransferase [Pelagibaculum spongiae]